MLWIKSLSFDSKGLLDFEFSNRLVKNINANSFDHKVRRFRSYFATQPNKSPFEIPKSTAGWMCLSV